MNITVNNHNIFLIIFVTFLISACIMPLIMKLAEHIGAVAIPNKRTVHSKPMPQLGGLAIFIAFLFGYMLFARTSIQMFAILISSFIIILTGICDDIKPIRARTKMLAQIIAALIIVLYGHICLDHIDVLGLSMDFASPIKEILTVFFIVAITNAINLVDGLDGLAGGISSIYFMTIIVISYLLGRMEGIEITLAIIMLGGTLGFLFHNFYPAKIFMGDTGSLFLGFIISIVALLGYKGATLTSLIIPVLILAIPIIDTILAMIRRTIKGEGIATADKEHFHHQLLKMNFSVRTSVLLIYGIDLVFAAVSVFYVLGDAKIAMIFYGILMLLLIVMIAKTDILVGHNKKNK